MSKNSALKEYKEKQKEEMSQKILEAAKKLKDSGDKVSVSNIANLIGVSRANLYANYKDIISDFSNVDKNNTINEQSQTLNVQSKNIDKLRKENKELREVNYKLMDQIVAMKIMLQSKIDM